MTVTECRAVDSQDDPKVILIRPMTGESLHEDEKFFSPHYSPGVHAVHLQSDPETVVAHHRSDLAPHS